MFKERTTVAVVVAQTLIDRKIMTVKNQPPAKTRAVINCEKNKRRVSNWIILIMLLHYHQVSMAAPFVRKIVSHCYIVSDGDQQPWCFRIRKELQNKRFPDQSKNILTRHDEKTLLANKALVSMRGGGGGGNQLISFISQQLGALAEPWLLYSIASCVMYASQVIVTKVGLRTMDSGTFQLAQLPFRIFAVLITAFKRSQAVVKCEGTTSTGRCEASPPKLLDLGFNGGLAHIACPIAAGTLCGLAGFFVGDALSSDGSASAVAVISGSYPALSYLMSIILGMERIQLIKCLGVTLSIGSCYCFAIS